ncbi:amidohydrolase family protein [Fulvivirgaceae bacterium BMA12]|uniref:Amidohydrolase family protein n=1 Tax=Agaribacillus aureus TaxID=3051825 RepID=A0ABT8LHW9_9BACT|nr:amidohydrolase family protein [Fulvivirgaceae bacterium BMA12]
MKNFSTLTASFLLLPLLGLGQNGNDMDFESYNPPSSLVVPEHPTKKAMFPFIDVHNHQWQMNTQDLSLLVAEMDKLNMAVMVNLSGKGYGNDAFFEEAMKNVKDHYPDRFVIFTNIDLKNIDDEDWTANAVNQLATDVEMGAKGLKIYKSQGMFNKDSQGNRIKINDPRLDPVWEKCGALGIPVLIHAADPRQFWETHDQNNERWLELKLKPRRKRSPNDPAPWQTIISEQHDIFRRHPGTTFINAHLGWYGNDLASLGKLMDELPNMYTEIGAVIAELGRQPRNARAWFIKYQDRVMFGKDFWNPKEYPTYFRVLETADEYFPYYKKYHAYWKMYGLDLPQEVLKKLYYKNALKVIPGINQEAFPE